MIDVAGNGIPRGHKNVPTLPRSSIHFGILLAMDFIGSVLRNASKSPVLPEQEGVDAIWGMGTLKDITNY